MSNNINITNIPGKQACIAFRSTDLEHTQADGYADTETVLTVNTFANRQTKSSKYSYYEGDPAVMLHSVAENWEAARAGYREGVIVVTVPAEGFYSGVCSLSTGDTLQGAYTPRQAGEEPRKTLGLTTGQKLPAKRVEVVLYSSEVLAEDKDNQLASFPGNWEVVSINASTSEGEEPIHPETLMHNHFGSSGGTTTHLTDEDFCATLKNSFLYWKDKAMIADNDDDKGEQ